MGIQMSSGGPALSNAHAIARQAVIASNPALPHPSPSNLGPAPQSEPKIFSSHASQAMRTAYAYGQAQRNFARVERARPRIDTQRAFADALHLQHTTLTHSCFTAKRVRKFLQFRSRSPRECRPTPTEHE
jgi:hypothetical protein